MWTWMYAYVGNILHVSCYGAFTKIWTQKSYDVRGDFTKIKNSCGNLPPVSTGWCAQLLPQGKYTGVRNKKGWRTHKTHTDTQHNTTKTTRHYEWDQPIDKTFSGKIRHPHTTTTTTTWIAWWNLISILLIGWLTHQVWRPSVVEEEIRVVADLPQLHEDVAQALSRSPPDALPRPPKTKFNTESFIFVVVG